jgi:hypothetical protein
MVGFEASNISRTVRTSNITLAGQNKIRDERLGRRKRKGNARLLTP